MRQIKWDKFFTNTEQQKNCYCCSSGTHMLNNCELRDTIARDQWFDTTRNMYNHNKKESDKGNEKIV